MDCRRNTKIPPLKPIQLISFDHNKNLILSQQALEVFKKIQSHQLHIITVAGKYRTGKSYILNRVLLGRNSGFQVGPTINACTKGLWMWPEIVKIDSAEGTKDCIIVDTEGLGSLEEGQNTDIKIFLMAILLSSYLIYNSVGSIDEKAIENLSLVINLAEMLHKDNNQYDSQQLINSFPSFMWLVRDFSLRLEDEKGESITSTEYLQSALRYQKSGTQAAQRKNSIRKKLKTFFQDRDCFTLVRPTENQRDLQNLSTLSDRLLRPEFVKLINEFKTTIHSNLKPKKVRGKTVTPQGFIQLCKYFVNTINQGKLPSINSHWDNLCIKESTRIIDHYHKCHKSVLQQFIANLSENQDKLGRLAECHKKVMKEAEQKINKSFLGKLEKELSKERLEKVLTEIYREVVKEINEKKYAMAKEIVGQIFVEILQEFEENKISSFQQIFARFEEIKQKYKHDQGIYQSFYQNSKDVFQQFVKNLKNHWEKEHMVLNQKNMYLESMISEKTKEMKQKLDEYSISIRSLEQKCYRIEIQYSQLQLENTSLKQGFETLNTQNSKLVEMLQQADKADRENIEKQMQQLKTKTDGQIKALNSENLKLSIQVYKLEEQIKDIHIKERKNQREMQIFKNKCSEYLKQNFTLAETMEKMKKKQMGIDKDRRKKGINWKEGDAIKQLSCLIDELEMKIAMREEENKNLLKTISNQKQANDTLLKAPHNINYSIMKKNYELEQENNKKYIAKLQDYELIHSMYSFHCQLCLQTVDKPALKTHVKTCTPDKDFHADVSYEYNVNGEIQFIVDVEVGEQEWTVRKTLQNIKYFLKKMGIECDLFNDVDPLSQDINLTQECRVYLDDLFNEKRHQIWKNSFLIEFFSIDLHFFNLKRNQTKPTQGPTMRSSRVSLDLNSVLEQNMSQNMMMKTTKFTKKCFNFGPYMA